ncbi:hypothetical protein ES332_D07G160600v1 [Gossypium tomentosum]|uniref:Uncharacterized protein n=1 Tax=Gossypium tomentosum TaxID=34277 RepID=A0A5D2K7Y7_GOSTO|nr:hypothetical protein ES332_D07G160600v1 [Gossypium tomentosum]
MLLLFTETFLFFFKLNHVREKVFHSHTYKKLSIETSSSLHAWTQPGSRIWRPPNVS